ncbi:MAG: hypothetical protein KC503_18835 [Myxococcales bacterium]|nr:hypothetical protein [Myxococcales bacterium]
MPGPVGDLVDALVDAVDEAYNFELDMTPETLPVLDQYLRDLADTPLAVRQHKLAAAGAYFGEVLRRALVGRWVLVGNDVAAWRVGLSRCFLHVNPMGMAGEVMVGTESDLYDGSFTVADRAHDEVSEMLSHAVPMPENLYYSLSGRLETVQLVADWLIARTLQDGEEPPNYSGDDYRAVIEAEAAGEQG